MSISIPNFNRAKILVVGDVMLDRYWQGAASRISPEAPVPVVNISGRTDVPGGAGNVALNLRALNSDVWLLGMIGQDAEGQVLQQQLQNHGVQTWLKVVKDLPTITKLRIIGRNQQLVRLDFEQGFHQVEMSDLIDQAGELLSEVDALIISDYNKGIVSGIPQIIALANKAGVPVLVDPKINDFSIYRGATLLTPNLKEFESLVGPVKDEQDLVQKGLALLDEYDFPSLLVTRGEQGMTLLQKDVAPIHFSAHTREVYDVTGAGDTVIALLAACLACQAPLCDAVMMANAAAGISVKKLGAATVSVPELRRTLQRQNDSHLGIMTQSELLQAVADARAHGETIVMTNGCFDLLHAGHVSYLEQAKALGHRLIVAVNSDESVSKLKGNSRPIVPLVDRMNVLAALRSVDWVVPFNEETPQRLIAEILPDILVKGADYQPEQIAGALEVMASGGSVKTIQLVDGASTSNIIKRIQQLEEAVV